MSEVKWSIFDDNRYDSEIQICRQCKKFTAFPMGEESLGVCCFLNKTISPHQLEWAVALGNIICEGFVFKS